MNNDKPEPGRALVQGSDPVLVLSKTTFLSAHNVQCYLALGPPLAVNPSQF